MEEVTVELALGGLNDAELAEPRLPCRLQQSGPVTWANVSEATWNPKGLAEVHSVLVFILGESAHFGVCSLPSVIRLSPGTTLHVKPGALMLNGITSEVLNGLLMPNLAEEFEALRKTLAKRVKKGRIW